MSDPNISLTLKQCHLLLTILLLSAQHEADPKSRRNWIPKQRLYSVLFVCWKLDSDVLETSWDRKDC